MTPILTLLVTALTTLNPIRVHVDGDGYMRFIRDGRVVYAKQATLSNVNGDLGADGAKLLPEIPVSSSVSSISIDLMGNVDAGSSHLGRLVLGIFPPGSVSSGIGAFLSFSDRATITNPGEDTAGVIRVDSAASSPSQADEPKPAKAQPAINPVVEDPKPEVSPTLHTIRPRLNLGIAGEGYFEVTGPQGIPLFTRSGIFKVLSTGEVATSSGFLLTPNITIPDGSSNLVVSASGSVTVIYSGMSEPSIVGQIELARFTNPSGLVKLDTDLYQPTAKCGSAIINAPGASGAGLIKFNGTLHGDASEIEATNATPKTTTTATHPKTGFTKTTPSMVGAQIQILVRQHTDIVGKNFTLGDIATITGPDELVTAYKKVSIGATAIAGVNRVIDQKYLALKLMGAGFHAGSYVLIVPEGSDVARKTVTVSAEDIIAKAVKAAQDKTGMNVDFKPTDLVTPIVAEEGEVSIEASEPVLNNKNYRVVVTVRQGTTIVSTRTIILTPPTELASIKMGDTVTVLFKAGSAVIEVQGRAITAGFVGQKIQVSVAGIGAKATTQTGTIIEAGKVEVDL